MKSAQILAMPHQTQTLGLLRLLCMRATKEFIYWLQAAITASVSARKETVWSWSMLDASEDAVALVLREHTGQSFAPGASGLNISTAAHNHSPLS